MVIGSATSESASTASARVEPGLTAMSEGQLLRLFAGRRDEAAFAVLVRRHGPMVHGICRQLLGDRHEAEDAFQVTFMVLARKAGSIRQPELVAAWLHGVALRTARKARALAGRRFGTQSLEETMRDGEGIGDGRLRELQLCRLELYGALHEEVSRLPDRYRVPVVLCYFQGQSHLEVSRVLGCPLGTVSVRLMRARGLLRARLTRRGLAPAAGMLAAETMAEAARAEVPGELADETVRAGVRFAAGLPGPAGSVSASVHELANHVLAGFASEAFHATATWSSMMAGLVLATLGVVFAMGTSPGEADRSFPGASGARPAGFAGGSRASGPRSPLPAAMDVSAADNGNSGSSTPAATERSITPGANIGTLETYRRLSAEAVRDPDAQVRLALWCEAQGLAAEKTRHLAMAVSLDPDHAKARGLLGMTSYRGRWRSADAVSEQVRNDPALTLALEEYRERRSRANPNPGSQWKLALWCEQNGLKAEMTAHLKRLVQLDPGHEPAWKRLGFRRHDGRWLTEQEIASGRAESEARKQAERRWKALLTRWRAWLGDHGRRAEAEQQLAGVSDPYAVPCVWRVFGAGGRSDQATAVRLLGQIDGPLAARMLGVLAFSSAWEEVRRAACETLARRDARAAVTLLAGRLRDPEPPRNATLYRYAWIPTGSRSIGSPGITYVEGRRANLLRAYTVDESFRRPTFATAGYEWRVASQRMRQQGELERIVSGLVAEALREFEANAIPIRELNARLIQTLRNITGKDRGDRWDAWAQWWVEELGYAYDPSDFANRTDEAWYAPRPTYVSIAHFSCFDAGTSVCTLDGLRPIESIRTGDQVLTRDVTTGSLRYSPVLEALHNEPAPTIRLDLEGTPVVVTGIHRFWKVGQGWVMARSLQPGDALRTIDGRVHVSGVSPDAVRPVFNLEVGEDQSFFVGSQGALVHDNSPVEAVPVPFDSVLDPTSLSGAAH